jgi:hypothetical protein
MRLGQEGGQRAQPEATLFLHQVCGIGLSASSIQHKASSNEYAAQGFLHQVCGTGFLHQAFSAGLPALSFLDRVPCIGLRHSRNLAPYFIRTALWFMAQRIAGDHVVKEFGDKGLVVKY